MVDLGSDLRTLLFPGGKHKRDGRAGLLHGTVTVTGQVVGKPEGGQSKNGEKRQGKDGYLFHR